MERFEDDCYDIKFSDSTKENMIDGCLRNRKMEVGYVWWLERVDDWMGYVSSRFVERRSRNHDKDDGGSESIKVDNDHFFIVINVPTIN